MKWCVLLTEEPGAAGGAFDRAGVGTNRANEEGVWADEQEFDRVFGVCCAD